MKRYIMFCWSDSVGGGQNYVDSKIPYLEKRDWEIYIFSPYSRNSRNKCPWPNLYKYAKNRDIAFRFAPETFSKKHIAKILCWMEKVIGKTNDETIIESHTDYFAEWGELLAKNIGAKNFCYLLDEQLENYGAKEFLYYKFLRKEVAGIHITSIPRLFRGFIDVPENLDYVLSAANNGSVREIPCTKIDSIPRMNFNIAYIGRMKQYSESIIDGICAFAIKHKKASIQFIVVGNISYLEKLEEHNNVYITKLGFLTPIPKTLFSHIDVAIAGAGCASISAWQGLPTIIADAGTCKAGGILGVTTKDALFNRDAFEFEDLLDKIFFDSDLKEKLKNLDLKPVPNVEDAYDRHFLFIENSSKEKVYFNFDEKPQNNGNYYMYKKYIRRKIFFFLIPMYRFFKSVWIKYMHKYIQLYGGG